MKVEPRGTVEKSELRDDLVWSEQLGVALQCTKMKKCIWAVRERVL